MSDLKVYVDYLSQPARAVLFFIKANSIDHEVKHVSIGKGENRTEEYKKNVHPFGKVPAVIDGGFRVIESVAIIRYLARKYQVKDNWYPKSLEGQTRVDEYLEWQHTGLRAPVAGYFYNKVVKPFLMGVKTEEKELEALKAKMETALDDFERIWLGEGNYIVGNQISVADIFALCEIDELLVINYDPGSTRPKLGEWLKRVRAELGPMYKEITKPLMEFAEIISKQQ